MDAYARNSILKWKHLWIN